ncbi:MAG: sigma-70 family RNA polymerase sigma factor [Acidimicrobiia bacterium]
MTVALIEELDDRTLVEQHRSGDDDAFRHIVLRHHRSLYANALRRLGDPVLAEDAVQETFLRAFRNLDRFEGEYHLDAWLHRIVTNACHDIGRRRGRDTRLFDRACTAVEVEAPPADDGLEVVPDHEFNAALDQLPETYREVLLLRFVEELSYPDVAQKAGISEENARARVSRGRTMLRKMMTSASGLVIWAIPPLRRAQMQVQDPDAVGAVTNVVSAAAPAAHSTSAFTNLVAQAGPAIASAGPAVTSAGPGVKAAVAAGLAAAVAIPTGVAVDRAMQKPVPQTAAPLLEDESSTADPSDPVQAGAKRVPTSSAAPSTSEPAKVSALSVGGSTEASVEGVTESSTDGSTTTPTSEPASTTSTPPTTDSGTPPPPPTQEPTPPPAEEPAPSGDLSAQLAVKQAGPHAVHLSGPIQIVVGDATYSGTLEGKLDLGEAGKDANAPRTVASDLNLTIDGTQLTLSLRGSAVVSEQAHTRLLELEISRFSFPGGASYGLAESGSLTGALEYRDDAGTLTLALPGEGS